MMLVQRVRKLLPWLFLQVKDVPVYGAMLSITGRVRRLNEDAVAYVLPRSKKARGVTGGLAVLADGMGGHAAGDVASRLAVEVILKVYFRQRAPVPRALMEAFMAANCAIREHARANPECAGMGTTCTALAFRDGAYYLAHIGDSRAYLLRDGKLVQISEDQSLVAAMERDGLLTPEQAAKHPDRNIVLQVLGTKPDISPQIWQEGMELKAGDRLLLCSDGLTDMVDEATIGALLAGKPLSAACRALVDAADDAGGSDNISVGVFTADAEGKEMPSITVRVLPTTSGEPS